MKIVIVGCGRVGSTLAENFDAEGHEVIILDTRTAAFDRLPETFKGSAVRGDGTDEEVLRRAGAQEADVFLSLTEGDNRNIMAAQVATDAAVYFVGYIGDLGAPVVWQPGNGCFDCNLLIEKHEKYQNRRENDIEKVEEDTGPEVVDPYPRFFCRSINIARYLVNQPLYLVRTIAVREPVFPLSGNQFELLNVDRDIENKGVPADGDSRDDEGDEKYR